MSKYKFSILFFIVFTAPLLGYFIGNIYWWLFFNSNPSVDKMLFSVGMLSVVLMANAYIAIEVES